MEQPIPITMLNDFIFCPASIYYHNIYAGVDKMVFQDRPQVAGTNAHNRIDDEGVKAQKGVVKGITVYSATYGLIGKIDKYFATSRKLIESKRLISHIYDGYIFQIYAQYFCLSEMGYKVDELALYSISDNKMYSIDLPENNLIMYEKFLQTIQEIKDFRVECFTGSTYEKCRNCIYDNICMFGG